MGKGTSVKLCFFDWCSQCHLQQTRSLAREEFLKKALIKKIARGVGISDEGTWT